MGIPRSSPASWLLLPSLKKVTSSCDVVIMPVCEQYIPDTGFIDFMNPELCHNLGWHVEQDQFRSFIDKHGAVLPDISTANIPGICASRTAAAESRNTFIGTGSQQYEFQISDTLSRELTELHSHQDLLFQSYREGDWWNPILSL